MKLSEIAKSVVASCKEYIDSCMGSFEEKLSNAVNTLAADFEDKLKELPQPKDPVSVDEIAKLVTAEIAKIPAAKDGTSVDAGEVKQMVLDAVKAAVAEIPAAKDGKDGDDGRDAAHLEILPEIDEAKSYKRGQWASHKGGLWRAFEKTAGMRGWECIVDGIDEISFEKFTGREIKIKMVKASGTEIESSVNMPVMLYKGIFREGEEYVEGDNVTYAGSLWYCNKSTRERPGTGSEEWQLAAKRGRDGKGLPGPAGKEGKPGKDAEDLRFLKVGNN